MIDTDTAEKMLLHKEFPRYPELAKRAGLEGTVLIRLWIGKDGTVKQVSIVKSDAEIFNEPSLEAAKRLLFRAASCNGIAISVWATIPMRFRLVN
jgi:protein TonB